MRFAATAPPRACRHGRGRTVTRSARAVVFVTVVDVDAPVLAVVSRIEGDTESPPCAAAARGAPAPSAAAICVAAAPAASAAATIILLRCIGRPPRAALTARPPTA